MKKSSHVKKKGAKNETPQDAEVLKHFKILEREQLSQVLLKLTEQRTEDRNQKRFDRENETIKLFGGGYLSLKDYKDFISVCRSEHYTIYIKAFYKEIYRLKGWHNLDPSKYSKPKEVALITNAIIYNRFPKEVLPTLQRLNPYISYGVRAHKHFQYLNPEGQQMVEDFVKEAISTMEECTTWHEFMVKYSALSGIVFQGSLFEVNS